MSSLTTKRSTGGGDRPALQIAILLNSYRSQNISKYRQSYEITLKRVCPSAGLRFFYPADPAQRSEDSEALPDPDKFDLIVIGGGNVDARKTHAWIVEVKAFVLRVVTEYPDKKMCGICWGHQVISLVLGGEIAEMAGYEVGVGRRNPKSTRV
jgi:GMP synthase-like glutamine amidotransferase